MVPNREHTDRAAEDDMAVTRNDQPATATPAPPLVGTIHEGIPVRDLDASLKFYVDVLGLQPLPRPKLPVPGAWLGRPEGGPQIHLIVGTDYVPGPDARMSPTGRHTAFAVADLDAFFDVKLVKRQHRHTRRRQRHVDAGFELMNRGEVRK